MFKNKLREKVLKIRKNLSKKNFKINFNKVFYLVKKSNLKNSIGGYFPVNYEIDDLEILKEFKKKNYQISLPVIKKNFDIEPKEKILSENVSKNMNLILRKIVSTEIGFNNR